MTEEIKRTTAAIDITFSLWIDKCFDEDELDRYFDLAKTDKVNEEFLRLYFSDYFDSFLCDNWFFGYEIKDFKITKAIKHLDGKSGRIWCTKCGFETEYTIEDIPDLDLDDTCPDCNEYSVIWEPDPVR